MAQRICAVHWRDGKDVLKLEMLVYKCYLAFTWMDSAFDGVFSLRFFKVESDLLMREQMISELATSLC